MIIKSHIPYPEHGSENKPSRIVIHAMGEYIKDGDKYIHASDFLKKLKLSAHILVSPNGDVYKCRNGDEIAYHARGYNTDSLGIEFLVRGNHDYGTFINAIKHPYVTDVQMHEGVKEVKEWLQLYNIQTIDRHSDLSPGRKVDPGDGFPWDRFLAKI